jgi:hypothetical protein
VTEFERLSQFERLGDLGEEAWTQSFRIRLGLLANKLYSELYGKKPPKVRYSTKPDWRNTVCMYPCGILEQAYRLLNGGGGNSRSSARKLLNH